MKMTVALGILITLTTLTSCAPVASSSPKLGQQRRGDSGVIDSNNTDKKFDLGVVPRAEVVSAESYEGYEKKTLRNFKTEKLEGKDKECLELRKNSGIEKIPLKADLNRIEILTVFIVDVPAKEINNGKDIKVNWLRGEKDIFSLSINEEETSYENWNLIKKSLSRVVVAYRTVDASVK